MNIIVKFIIWGILFGLFFTIGYKIISYLKKNKIKDTKIPKSAPNFNNKNNSLIKAESSNKILLSEINTADFNKMNSLVEIKDSKVLGHINNLIPELAKTGNTINNAKRSSEVLYQAIIPKGAKLCDSTELKGAVRGMYRGDKGIKGHANLVAVDNSKNAMQNVMASGLNATSMVVGQYYMAQIDNKLEEINNELSKIKDFQVSEYRGKIIALISQIKQCSKFQIEIIANEEFRTLELQKLNSIEHICIELLGQANDYIDKSIGNNSTSYDEYEKTILEINKWYSYQKILLCSLGRISDLRFTLNFGKMSVEQCSNLFNDYSEMTFKTNSKLKEWNQLMEKKFEINSQKLVRKRDGFDGVIHYVPGLINDDMHYKKISEKTLFMIKNQETPYKVDLIKDNNSFNKDIKIISKDNKIYYLPE